MEVVKRIDETLAVTGRWRLVIQIINGKQVVCKQVLWGGKLVHQNTITYMYR